MYLGCVCHEEQRRAQRHPCVSAFQRRVSDAERGNNTSRISADETPRDVSADVSVVLPSSTRRSAMHDDDDDDDG